MSDFGKQGQENTDTTDNSSDSARGALVKVYYLTDAGWEDGGTGIVSVKNDTDGGFTVLVTDASTADHSVLFSTKIQPDIHYQLSKESILQWKEPTSDRNYAISFSHAASGWCQHIWQSICAYQDQCTAQMQNVEIDELDLLAGGSRNDYDRIESGSSGFQSESQGAVSMSLPPPALTAIPEIARIVNSVVPSTREHILIQLLERGYIEGLLDLFESCEDLDDVDALHDIYSIFKGLIMLNSEDIFNVLLAEENLLRVIGTFEYDPTKDHPQPHRKFLQERAKMKKIVTFSDTDILAKAEQNYRIQYLKDIVFPQPGGVMDDASCVTMSSTVYLNSIEILIAITKDSQALSDLRKILLSSTSTSKPEEEKEKDMKKKKEVILFIQEMCNIAKDFPAEQRGVFFAAMFNSGLFICLDWGLQVRNYEIELAIYDILGSIVMSDPATLRRYLLINHMGDEGGANEYDFIYSGSGMESEGERHATKRQKVSSSTVSSSSSSSEPSASVVSMSKSIPNRSGHDDPPHPHFRKAKGFLLFSTIIERFVCTPDVAAKTQLFEILRTLLDSRFLNGQRDRDEFLETFYSQFLPLIVAPLDCVEEKEKVMSSGSLVAHDKSKTKNISTNKKKKKVIQLSSTYSVIDAYNHAKKKLSDAEEAESEALFSTSTSTVHEGVSVGVGEKRERSEASSSSYELYTYHNVDLSDLNTRRELESVLLQHVIDLLEFCVSNHSFRARYFILASNSVKKIVSLLNWKDTRVRISAIKFLKAMCIPESDAFYARYLVNHNIFQHIVQNLDENGGRYNMINSCLLDLFETVIGNNTLLVYVAPLFGEKLVAKHQYVDTFRRLMTQFEECKYTDSTGGGGAGAADKPFIGPKPLQDTSSSSSSAAMAMTRYGASALDYEELWLNSDEEVSSGGVGVGGSSMFDLGFDDATASTIGWSGRGGGSSDASVPTPRTDLYGEKGKKKEKERVPTSPPLLPMRKRREGEGEGEAWDLTSVSANASESKEKVKKRKMSEEKEKSRSQSRSQSLPVSQSESPIAKKWIPQTIKFSLSSSLLTKATNPDSSSSSSRNGGSGGGSTSVEADAADENASQPPTPTRSFARIPFRPSTGTPVVQRLRLKSDEGDGRSGGGSGGQSGGGRRNLFGSVGDVKEKEKEEEKGGSESKDSDSLSLVLNYVSDSDSDSDSE